MWVDLRSLWETSTSPIEGTGVITSVAVGALLGTGALSGVSVSTIIGAGQELGTIADSGVAVITSVGVGNLTGSGGLSGTSVSTTVSTGALVGTATLSGTSVATTYGIGDLLAANSGAIFGTGVITMVGVGELLGVLPLSGVSVSTTYVVGQLVDASAPVITDQPSGGWPIFATLYEAEVHRRKLRAKQRKEDEEESESIPDKLDRSIALLLREQEAKDERRQDLERLATLAKQHTDLEAVREYSSRVATAYERAVKQGNFSALAALDRELQRATEEEELLLLAILMIDAD